MRLFLSPKRRLGHRQRIYHSPQSGPSSVTIAFRESAEPGGKGSRRWKAGVSELERLSRSYNIPVPQKLAQYITDLQSSKSNGSNGTNGHTNGTVTSASQTTFEDLIKSKSDQDVNQPCYACGTLEWKSFPDGSGYFCGTCHPK